MQDEVGSLRRLGAVFEDAARKATEDWLSRFVHQRAALPAPIDENHEWPSLVDRVRELAMAGHDVEPLLRTAVTMRSFGDSRSSAGVLHWRLGQLTDGAIVRGGHRLDWVPESPSPYVAVARRAAELMAERREEIRQSVELAERAAVLGARGRHQAAPVRRSR